MASPSAGRLAPKGILTHEQQRRTTSSIPSPLNRTPSGIEIATENWLVGAALDAHSFGGGLDEKVADEFGRRIAAVGDLGGSVRRWSGHFERQTKGAREGVGVAHDERARSLIL